MAERKGVEISQRMLFVKLRMSIFFFLSFRPIHVTKKLNRNETAGSTE
jgi:hypothetical protein